MWTIFWSLNWIFLQYSLFCLLATRHVGSWFPVRGSNLLPLHWKVKPQPLDHQGSPCMLILLIFFFGIFLKSTECGSTNSIFLSLSVHRLSQHAFLTGGVIHSKPWHQRDADSYSWWWPWAGQSSFLSLSFAAVKWKWERLFHRIARGIKIESQGIPPALWDYSRNARLFHKYQVLSSPFLSTGSSPVYLSSQGSGKVKQVDPPSAVATSPYLPLYFNWNTQLFKKSTTAKG